MTKRALVTARARSRALENTASHTAEKLYATGYEALGHGNSDVATQTFLLMAGVVPFDARAWVGLGTSLEQQGKLQRALGVYTLGRTLAPASVYCKLGEARVLGKLGQHSRAQSVLDVAATHANHTHELQLIERLRGEL